MNRIIIVFVLFFISGCSEKDKIEIYLLKRRMPIKDGISYAQATGITDSLQLKQYEYVNYDTIFNEPISSGRFEANRDDLNNKPFVKDDGIVSFNIKSNDIVFTQDVVKQIQTLSEDQMHKGIQFVIAVNGEPELTGYFMHWSVWCDWYYIRYFKEGEGLSIKDKTKFELYNGYMRGKHEDLTPPYPPKLIEAFRQSGRLIE